MILAFLALVLSSSHSAHAASVCDGLGTGFESSNFQEALLLTPVPQAPNQYKVTGCGKSSHYPDRPACQRADKYGQLNGRFGSCATYSAFSAAIVIAARLGIEVPESLEYRSENLVRLYDLYGNPWDTVSPGKGSFTHILRNILHELAETLPENAPQRVELVSFADRYHRVRIEKADLGDFQAPSTQTLIRTLRDHFNAHSSYSLLPVEIVLDGWVLDRDIVRYCPVRDANGKCATEGGRDNRGAHSALIVGRQFWRGECYVEIRNSWKACENGKYGRSNNNCFSENDFVWIREGDLVKGMSAIRRPL